MPGSRLLPAEQRSALPAAPTTSGWWRTHVLVRSWLNRHRRGWLAPLLVCVPPLGVAMVWAGATRPGHQRRWLTAAAGVWMIALGLLVSLLALPGAAPADAGGAPGPVAGGPAVVDTPTASATPTRDTAAAAAAVRGAPPRGAGVGGAAVQSSTANGAADEPPASGAGDGSDDDSGTSGSGDRPDPTHAGPTAANPPSAPSSSTKPPRATPTPTPPPTPPHHQPTPPRHPQTQPNVPTAYPFTACSSEGAHAVTPSGIPLRCYRTPIGLFWLWGQ